MLDLNWYNTLNHPPLTPPWWVFAPVWTFLYLTMLTALFLFVSKPSLEDKSWGYTLFFSQIGINLCWMPAFFYLKNPAFALVLIIVLDILVLLNIIAFYNVSKSSARTLIPYFIWILFATYLNVGIYVLN